MDSVVINGKHYYSEDDVRAKSIEMARACVVMAVNSIENTLKELRQMMNIPQDFQLEIYPGEKSGISTASSILVEEKAIENAKQESVDTSGIEKIVAELRKEDMPTAALIQGSMFMFFCRRYRIAYIHIPQFMAPLLLRDGDAASKRHASVTKAVRAVYGQDAMVTFVSSAVKNFDGALRKLCEEIESNLLTEDKELWMMTPGQRTTYVSWCLVNAEIELGLRKFYKYDDIASASGIGYSLVYHAMQRLKECGYVNLDKLVGRGLKNNAA